MDSDTDGGVGAHDMTPYAAPPQDELVLIADDEPTIAEVVAALVTDAGYRAVVATHGRQALELAQTVWPALVITDLMMPVLDGAGLIAALQEAAAATGRPRIPVILITAASAPRVRIAGADMVLAKPFDLDHLEQAMHQLLAGATSADR